MGIPVGIVILYSLALERESGQLPSFKLERVFDVTTREIMNWQECNAGKFMARASLLKNFLSNVHEQWKHLSVMIDIVVDQKYE